MFVMQKGIKPQNEKHYIYIILGLDFQINKN